jgi:YidC/Oxa1 family membrane protein insertase
MDNKNLILAIVLSVAIMFGFNYAYEFFYPPPPEAPKSLQQQAAPGTAAPAPEGMETQSPTTVPPAMVPPVDQTPSAIQAPSATQAPPPAHAPPVTRGAAPPSSVLSAEQRAKALAMSPRVQISTPQLHGSISLVGGRLDDLTLAKYHETLNPKSPEIVLFSPAGAPDAYFTEVGWVATDGKADVPGPDTLWTADRETLTPESPVTLSWDNGAGLTFKRIFAVDDDYMFTMTQRVENNGKAPVALSSYGLISRHGTPPVSGFYILFEGPLGVLDGTLKEVKYSELQEEGVIQQNSIGGWIGITDKYWLAALVPNQKEAINTRFVDQRHNNKNIYQVDYVGGEMTVAPGGSVATESRVFAGAKQVRLLDRYEEEYSIPRFDLAIDFGWFYFLTKPLFYFLLYITDWVGNVGVAILLLTVVVKLAFFPLANKSYKSMSQMRKLQPEMLKLRERFSDDKTRLNQEMMALYKREKVNPASGCLPMIVQIPVFFALYKVLFVTIEMRHAPFFGWIHDLSARDPTTVWNLFGLIPWDPFTVIPDPVNIGAWPLIMGITMFLQQKLNPQPPDPMQAKIFMFLPIVFTFMLASFPAGLVVYWTWNNTLSIIQQWVIMRRAGVKIRT